MRNLWVQTERAFATWDADITPLLDKPESLVDLVCGILEAAEECDVAVPVEVPRMGLSCAGKVRLADVVRKRWQVEAQLELFRSMEGARFAAQLAWFDGDNQIIERPTDDLAALLAGLQPVPGAIDRKLIEPGYSPVAFSGLALAYPDRREPARRPLGSASFSCELHSDIWFPYVLGHAHPSCDLKHWFDNRELATRHTPRLNAFIERCALLATAAGAHWHVANTESDATLLPFIHDRGIHLDARAPELMPPEALDVIWEALDV